MVARKGRDVEPDIRLHVGAPDHPKVERLCRALGDGAFRCLVRLWCWAAVNRRVDGRLAGMSDDDVELVAKWAGERGAFARGLREARLVDVQRRTGRISTLHDWEENQPWHSGAAERSKAAQAAALERWRREREQDAERMQVASGADAPSVLPSDQERGSRSGARGRASAEGAAPARAGEDETAAKAAKMVLGALRSAVRPEPPRRPADREARA